MFAIRIKKSFVIFSFAIVMCAGMRQAHAEEAQPLKDVGDALEALNVDAGEIADCNLLIHLSDITAARQAEIHRIASLDRDDFIAHAKPLLEAEVKKFQSSLKGKEIQRLVHLYQKALASLHEGPHKAVLIKALNSRYEELIQSALLPPVAPKPKAGVKPAAPQAKLGESLFSDALKQDYDPGPYSYNLQVECRNGQVVAILAEMPTRHNREVDFQFNASPAIDLDNGKIMNLTAGAPLEYHSDKVATLDMITQAQRKADAARSYADIKDVCQEAIEKHKLAQKNAAPVPAEKDTETKVVPAPAPAPAPAKLGKGPTKAGSAAPDTK